MQVNLRVYGSKPRVIWPFDVDGKVCPHCRRGNLAVAAKSSEVVIVVVGKERFAVHGECAEEFAKLAAERHAPKSEIQPLAVKAKPMDSILKLEAELARPVFWEDFAGFDPTKFKGYRIFIALSSLEPEPEPAVIAGA